MYSMLMYDIPSACPIANPSGRLRRCAIRVNLSVWVVRDDSTPHNLLNRLHAAGVSWHLIPYATDANEGVYALCRDALRAEADRLAKSLQRSIARADARYVEDGDRNAYYRRLRAAHARCERLATSYASAAATFDLTYDVDDALAGLARQHARAVARAAAFASMTQTVSRQDLRAAAEEDSIPASILADAIEDERGEDMADVHALFEE